MIYNKVRVLLGHFICPQNRGKKSIILTPNLSNTLSNFTYIDYHCLHPEPGSKNLKFTSCETLVSYNRVDPQWSVSD